MKDKPKNKKPIFLFIGMPMKRKIGFLFFGLSFIIVEQYLIFLDKEGNYLTFR